MKTLKHPLITLSTDFGEQDFYVAAMKGVLASRCPKASILDLSHSLPPQDIMSAALLLEGCMPCFPDETVHMVVVDPGVGTSRRPIAARLGGQYFVCPDNGLLTLVLKKLSLIEARIITNPACMTATVSTTFHGRDIFAPTAAYLASGEPFSDVGPILETLQTLDIPEPVCMSETTVSGTVIHVDSFGTVLSNITRETLPGKKVRRVRLGPLVLEGIGKTFSDVPLGKPVAYFGSSERLEIAVNCGHAAREYNAGVGDSITVEVSS
ncbi:MAG: SAM-dependent chlorinase/fluorinase [Candidatus Hydrogenedentota bacterium]